MPPLSSAEALCNVAKSASAVLVHAAPSSHGRALRCEDQGEAVKERLLAVRVPDSRRELTRANMVMVKTMSPSHSH